VTLIPAMADETAHITMLQRSPSYIATVPKRNHVATALAHVLPGQQAHDVVRKVNIRVWRAMYETCQKHPVRMRRVIRAMTKLQLPKGYPVDVDFNPTYDPWDQRLCAVPDGDLFKAIKAGRASVVTDRIARFTERGILLESGRELEADIIVTATGLNMLAFGHVELSVDGVPIVPSETVAFKSMLVSGVPNFAFALGYTNISWTLKVDLVCEHLCRLVADVEARGKDYVIPVLDEPGMERLPLLDFAAGYVQRGVAGFPRRGTRGPWTVEQDYLADVRRLREGPVTDPALRYGTAVREPALT
jgi:monooxygenase